MSHLTIRGLLQQRLAAWATTKGLPVAWQGVSFAPPSGMYLRAFMLPAGTDSIDIEGVMGAVSLTDVMADSNQYGNLYVDSAASLAISITVGGAQKHQHKQGQTLLKD